jgi:hypothetical protein
MAQLKYPIGHIFGYMQTAWLRFQKNYEVTIEYTHHSDTNE